MPASAAIAVATLRGDFNDDFNYVSWEVELTYNTAFGTISRVGGGGEGFVFTSPRAPARMRC